MKKLISILLAAAMLLSLAACTSTAAADDTESVPASSDTSTETPPEKPDGEAPAMSGGETPPEKPDGTPPDGANGQPGTPPDSNPPDGAPNGQPGGFGGSGEVTQGTSANTISEDTAVTGTSYSSTGDDENALRVDGAAVTLDGITVDKRADATSNTEDGDFYGMNAALLATNGATVTIKNATVNSSAQNGNGVFSYGAGTTVNISDSTITTSADNSGGIQTTGGGTTNAENLTVTTSGNSSAAIRSDRGGGTVNVTGGSYTSNGYNSPAVYSTAAITVKNAKLTANNSESLVIEGKNSIALENCTVSGNMSSTKGSSSSENVHTVMIYQSMSGDAQALEGNILVDTISTLDLTLQNGSSFTGTINIVDNAEGGAAVSDNAVVTIGSGCTWTLTGNCTITSLTNNGKINFSGHTITLADGTVLRG